MLDGNYTYIEEKELIVTTLSEETAWGGCLEGAGDEWWYYLEVDTRKDDKTGQRVPAKSTETLWAAQFTDVGTVTYDPVLNTITICFRDGWTLQDIKDPIKIQGYNKLPGDKPSSILFTTYKGEKTTVKVAPYSYYAIQLDVQLCE
ncbi:MAG TPA: hypothetical protein DEQ09_04930 [Bacteroidales bacterium]|nr:hypothetical protein [Bacteroidales bacterium]